MTNSKSGNLLERAKRFAQPEAARRPVELSETSVADWHRCWQSRHPEPYQWSERRATIEEIRDFLESNEGSLGEISVRMVEGRFFASIEAWDRRGGIWFLPDGILPPECDRIRECLRVDDHGPCDASAAEALIAAAIATVLHLRGIYHPIAIWNRLQQRSYLAAWLDKFAVWNRLQQRSCLVAWLDQLRRKPAMPESDHWDAMATEVNALLEDLAEDLAEEVLFNAEFPRTGPSGKWIALLREANWSWHTILDHARSFGYKGTKGALRARLDRARNTGRRSKEKHLRVNRLPGNLR